MGGTPNAEYTKWRKIAEKNNIKARTFKGRVDNGWTYSEAATFPTGFKKESEATLKTVSRRTNREIEDNITRMYKGGYLLSPKQLKYLEKHPTFRAQLERYNHERNRKMKTTLFSAYVEREPTRTLDKSGYIATDKLVELVKGTGQSYNKLSKIVGVSTTSLCDTCNRSKFASKRTVNRLVEYFGADKNELFDTGTEEMLNERKERRGQSAKTQGFAF